MMSQKESPRNHPWVLPRQWFELPFNLALKKIMGASYLQSRAGQVTTDWEKKRTGDSNQSEQSLVTLPCLVCSRDHPGSTNRFFLPISSNPVLPSTHDIRRKHPSLAINLELGTHTKQATFLGSTHGGFLGDSFCDIINGSQCRKLQQHFLIICITKSVPQTICVLLQNFCGNV